MEDESIILWNLKNWKVKLTPWNHLCHKFREVKSNKACKSNNCGFMLFKQIGLCTKPSFHNFYEATKKLYDVLENKEELMCSI